MASGQSPYIGGRNIGPPGSLGGDFNPYSGKRISTVYPKVPYGPVTPGQAASLNRSINEAYFRAGLTDPSIDKGAVTDIVGPGIAPKPLTVPQALAAAAAARKWFGLNASGGSNVSPSGDTGAPTSDTGAPSGAPTGGTGTGQPTGTVDLYDLAKKMINAEAAGQLSTMRAGIAAQAAQDKASQDVLSRYGQAVTAYLTDAATRAGRDYESQAAAQAVLGALGQQTLQGAPLGGMFLSRPEYGMPAAAEEVARQGDVQRLNAGAYLNQVLGSGAGAQLLAEARRATERGLAGASGSAGYTLQLLKDLAASQGANLAALRQKRDEFAGKIPGLVSQRYLDLVKQQRDEALAQSLIGSRAGSLANEQERIGLAKSRLDLDTAKYNSSLAKASTLSPSQLATRRTNAYKFANALLTGAGAQRTKVQNGKEVIVGTTITKPAVSNFQRAYSEIQSAYGDVLSPQDILTYLEKRPEFAVKGISTGRPFLNILERDVMKRAFKKAGSNSYNLVDSAAFNEDLANQLLNEYNSLGG